MGSPNGTSLWMAILRTQQAMDRVARQSMSDAGLGFSDFTLLEVLYHLGPLTPSQLVEKLALTKGSVTIAIDRQVERKLVERVAHKTDARSCLVRITPKGKSLFEPSWKIHKQDIESIMDKALAPAERKQLFQLLMKVREVANGAVKAK